MTYLELGWAGSMSLEMPVRVVMKGGTGCPEFISRSKWAVICPF